MKSWTVVIWLVVSQLVELGCGKRFDPAMVDPLMRRSSLEKNFMRFGRSSPAYEEKDEADESPREDVDSDDSYLRSMRARDNNFMRFGRGKNDNFMRFGRGKQDSFMRFGRARNDNYMRFGRARDNNFMRFGRGKQDNFMRFGRGKEDNYMRFGRGKEDNYMRFGRGKEDNYMRFGRGKQDNFMRFGKGVNYGKQDSFMRLGRGKQGNFMRFGRDFTTQDNLSSHIVYPLYPKTYFYPLNDEDDVSRTDKESQSYLKEFGKTSVEDLANYLSLEVQPKPTPIPLIRWERGNQNNFMRFGKSDDGNLSSQGEEGPVDKDTNDIQNNLASVNEDADGFPREVKSKDDVVRVSRHPLSTNNAFIRYGRSSETQPEENVAEELIPQRLKRSLGSTPPPDAEDSLVDYVSAKLRLQSSSPSQPHYEASLLAAGLPNVIVGPEFSLLPQLDPPASMLKRGRPGDNSFLRLG